MKKRYIFISGGTLAGLAVIGFIILAAVGGNNAPTRYQFAEATRGPVQVTVASTGSISAQKTVDVGTQVSGLIAKIYVDFNDHVQKGRILARLDTTLLDLAVRSASADQMKANAQYELALKDYRNNLALHDNKLISDYDFETSRVAKDAAYAGKLSADAALSRANINLDYAVIRAPIDGVIINRAVEEGQTVAASLAAPTLFTIAEDLSRIRIMAYVAESDIGSIKSGQRVTFTVSSYALDVFTGKVNIIHLQSETVSNVVNYVVMVNATNPGLKLMPGMTATVTFIIDERQDALLVPNAVLQYRPSDELLAAFYKDHPQVQSGRQNGATRPAGRGAAVTGTPDGTAAADRNVRMLWGLDENGQLTGISVTMGITDGQKTEIISDKVSEGMKFLTKGGGAVKQNTGGNQRGFGPGRLF